MVINFVNNVFYVGELKVKAVSLESVRTNILCQETE